MIDPKPETRARRNKRSARYDPSHNAHTTHHANTRYSGRVGKKKVKQGRRGRGKDHDGRVSMIVEECYVFLLASLSQDPQMKAMSISDILGKA